MGAQNGGHAALSINTADNERPNVVTIRQEISF